MRRTFATVFEFGSALLTIREGRLYRATHATFEQYCRERWGIGRSYASRQIGAAERLKLLPLDGQFPRPQNEFQIRPFLRLEPDVFPKAWEQAVKRAKGEALTPALLRAVAAEMAPDLPGRSGMRPRLRRSRSNRTPIGKFLALLQDARKSTEKGDAEHVLAVLQEIEDLLVASPPS